MSDFDNLVNATDRIENEEVWTLYGKVGKELEKRGLVRTKNYVGERGESLAIETYDKTPRLPKLQKAPEGTQNVDALSRKGERYNIKTVREPSDDTGAFYGCGGRTEANPERKFEYVFIVLIDECYELKQVLELTWEQFLRYRRWNARMSAWKLALTQELVAEAKKIFP